MYQDDVVPDLELDLPVPCADCMDPGAYWCRGRMLCEPCWDEQEGS